MGIENPVFIVFGEHAVILKRRGRGREKIVEVRVRVSLADPVRNTPEFKPNWKNAKIVIHEGLDGFLFERRPKGQKALNYEVGFMLGKADLKREHTRVI